MMVHQYSRLLGFWTSLVIWYSKTQTNTAFQKLDKFPSSGEGWEIPTWLGPLERANLNHRTTGLDPCLPPLTWGWKQIQLLKHGDLLCVLEYQRIDSTQKPSNPECKQACLAYSSILKTKVICSSETPADFHQTTQRYISEDRTLHNHCCENLKSNSVMTLYLPIYKYQSFGAKPQVSVWAHFVRKRHSANTLSGILSHTLKISCMGDMCKNIKDTLYLFTGEIKTVTHFTQHQHDQTISHSTCPAFWICSITLIFCYNSASYTLTPCTVFIPETNTICVSCTRQIYV
jgi:hypothetical protein